MGEILQEKSPYCKTDRVVIQDQFRRAFMQDEWHHQKGQYQQTNQENDEHPNILATITQHEITQRLRSH